MTVTDPPQPPERPEDEGLPDHAADTSTAYDEADRPRFDDSPPALPADEPQALDEFGVTGPEARRGEPLDEHLAREEPDVGAEQRYASPGPRVAGDGAASAYDQPESGGPAGRLVEPDEGARPDTEKDLIADDVGEAGGGQSAEEAAMHEVAEDEVPYRP